MTLGQIQFPGTEISLAIDAGGLYIDVRSVLARSDAGSRVPFSLSCLDKVGVTIVLYQLWFVDVLFVHGLFAFVDL